MSSTLAKLLEEKRSSGLFRISEDANALHILAIAAAQGWVTCHLHGSDVVDKASLLAQMATTCSFPAYFGHNWDAFEEMLVDPSWRPVPGLLLLYDDPVTLARRDPAAWRTLYAILRAATAMQATDAPLIVLFRNARRLVPDALWI